MTRPCPLETEKKSNPQRCGGGLVFWILILMGFSTLAPCVLLSQWRQLQAIHLQEQKQENRLISIERRLDQQRRLHDAMLTDPEVMARLAQRDLGFKRVGQREVVVAVYDSTAPIPDEQFKPSALSLPAPLARVASLLPDYNWDGVFCGARTRPVVMALSIGLIALAFALFGRRYASSAGVQTQ